MAMRILHKVSCSIQRSNGYTHDTAQNLLRQYHNVYFDNISPSLREPLWFSNPAKAGLVIRLYLILLEEKHLEHVIKSIFQASHMIINKKILELEYKLSHLGKPLAAKTGVGSPSSLTWYQSPIHAVQPDPHRSGPKLAHRSLPEDSEIDAQIGIISRGRIRHKVSHIGSWKGSLVGSSSSLTSITTRSCDLDGSGSQYEGSKNATLQLVDMECSYITVDFNSSENAAECFARL
ncbi:hypothetical protein YC2023_015597 [Brassica napus]